VKLLIAISQQTGKKKQGGMALLILVIVLSLTISAFYFSSISIVELQVDQVEKTQIALKRAKQALMDYALVNWRLAGEGGKIGKLPCPDYKDTLLDGEQDGNCGNAYANGIGYFPWRTLGIDITKDSSGSCLLYAVSPAYKTSPAAALNPDSYGQFRIVDKTGATLQGGSPEERLVAVIIAPESTLTGQKRVNDSADICGFYYSNNISDLIEAYLDNDGSTNNAAIDPSTNNVIENFVAKYTGSEEGNNPLNDRLITISHREFWDAMQDTITGPSFNASMRNLTEALALCLAEYAKDNDSTVGKKSLPWPAAIDLNGNEYRNNYSYDDNIDDSSGHAGRLPYQVLNSNATIGNSLTEVAAPYAGFFEYGFCSSLPVSDGSTIDLTDKNGEYWNLWSNWKEYFFYALSKSYNPDNTGVDCTAGCIQLSGNNAGIVFYSGPKQGVQQRYAPPLDGALAIDNEDDKDDIANYIENSNDAVFPDANGDKSYSPVDASTSNDIMFCIKTDMSVVECL
jgi:hypothetical protein